MRTGQLLRSPRTDRPTSRPTSSSRQDRVDRSRGPTGRNAFAVESHKKEHAAGDAVQTLRPVARRSATSPGDFTERCRRVTPPRLVPVAQKRTTDADFRASGPGRSGFDSALVLRPMRSTPAGWRQKAGPSGGRPRSGTDFSYQQNARQTSAGHQPVAYSQSSPSSDAAAASSAGESDGDCSTSRVNSPKLPSLAASNAVTRKVRCPNCRPWVNGSAMFS